MKRQRDGDLEAAGYPQQPVCEGLRETSAKSRGGGGVQQAAAQWRSDAQCVGSPGWVSPRGA